MMGDNLGNMYFWTHSDILVLSDNKNTYQWAINEVRQQEQASSGRACVALFGYDYLSAFNTAIVGLAVPQLKVI